jgi:hypothetical protein
LVATKVGLLRGRRRRPAHNRSPRRTTVTLQSSCQWMAVPSMRSREVYPIPLGLALTMAFRLHF